MEWASALIWIDVPVADDGSEAPLASRSTLRAYVGWEVAVDHATPVAALLRRTDGRAVTSAEWRRLKSSEIIAASRNLLLGTAEFARIDPATSATGVALTEVLDADKPIQVGRSRYSDQHYRRVASAYNTAVVTEDTQPVQAVRRALRSEFPGLTETTVRGWIQAAKRRGYITKTARPSRAKNTKGGER